MTTARTARGLMRRPLRSHRARRALVIAVAALAALLSSALPLHGFAILVVLALAGLDILLIRSTDVLAFRRRHHLDERELWLRDLAHRRGFRWIGLAAILLAVIAYFSAVPVLAGGVSTWVDSGMTGRVVIAAAEVLLMTPTALVAWTEPGIPMGESPAARTTHGRLAWLVVPGLAAAWLAVIAWAPPQSAPPGSFFAGGGGLPGSACQEFAGGTIIGAEFGATVGFRADVCWNGREAFVVGNPGLPLPADEVARLEREYAAYPPEARPPLNFINPAMPIMSGCGLDNVSDFATVGELTCVQRIDSGGTLHYSVSATVSPLPFSLGSRHVTVELVVGPDGKVLLRP